MSTVGKLLERFLPGGSDGPREADETGKWTLDDRTGFDGSVEGAEVIGRSPLSYLAAGESVGTLFANQTEQKLAAHGIEHPQPDEWYPLEGALAMLYELREEYGKDSLQTMGRHIPEHVEFPPEISGVEEALRSIDGAYHQNHRGGDIGSYEYIEVEESNAARIACENPYPCELDQGLIKGVARQFADSTVEVEEVGDRCRADGSGRCEYRVEWFAG